MPFQHGRSRIPVDPRIRRTGVVALEGMGFLAIFIAPAHVHVPGHKIKPVRTVLKAGRIVHIFDRIIHTTDGL